MLGVLTMRTAAALLASPPGLPSLHAIAASAGCAAGPEILSLSAREALGLPHELSCAAVSAGAGALRALLVAGADAMPAREHVTRIASRLASRTPQLLWIVVAEDREASERVIATWRGDRMPPRVVALTAERDRIVDSDAETVCALAAATSSSDSLTHARWIEILGRDALTRRFYRTLERTIGTLAGSLTPRAPEEDRRSIALFTVSRLLFLSFLEAKGWLDGDRDYLSRRFMQQLAAGGRFHSRVLEPLFFGTLNTRPDARAVGARALGSIPYLNGGLFTRSPLERRWRRERFPDEALGTVFDDLLSRHRLTAREDRSSWSDAAVDPAMLGRAFESLMAAPERRSSGAYYTPHALVERTLGDALTAHLGVDVGEDVSRALVEGQRLQGGDVPPDLGTRVHDRLACLRLLDPACGSGAFLVHALERIADLLKRCGDRRDVGVIRADVVTRSIFGVDLSPTAVWLCELRLWLSVVIETEVATPRDVRPLPNLDHNVRVGDSLAGSGFASSPIHDARHTRSFRRLRDRYARASGPRKRTLMRELERAEREAGRTALAGDLARVAFARRELLLARRQRDLFGDRSVSTADTRTLADLRARSRELRTAERALRDGRAVPFAFAAHFADVAGDGGFDIVVGNPPWVRLHNIPSHSRDRLRRDYQVFRMAAWESGAIGAGAGRGFAAQVDMASLFVERSVHLLREGGTLALLVPAKLWRSLAGGGLRRFLATEAPPLSLDDWSDSTPAFDAAVYPSLLVARRTTLPADDVTGAVHYRDTALRWRAPRVSLPLDSTPGSPWVIAPPEVRAAFDLLARRGVALAATSFGRPLLGVKCGLNEAFLVTGETDLDPSMLRPVVRGESLTPWRASPDERIVWTHGEDGRALTRLPERTRRWLVRFQRQLAARSDARGRGAWWSLFRVDSAASTRPRVIWADMGRSPRAAFVDAGDPIVALNSCYVARCDSVDDALALTALLNSPLAAAWLSLVAEPARGGYHRYLGWTMALLPLPRDWVRARDLLAPLTARALAGSPPSSSELLELACHAYRVRRSDIAALVTWAAR